MRYVVQLTEQGNCYGPFDDKGNAEEFAVYLTSEVDPAVVRNLGDPAMELIGFYNSVVLPDRRRPEPDPEAMFWKSIQAAGHLDCGEWSAAAGRPDVIACRCGAEVPLLRPS